MPPITNYGPVNTLPTMSSAMVLKATESTTLRNLQSNAHDPQGAPRPENREEEAKDCGQNEPVR